MADTQSVVSDVKLFLEKLKKDLPEVFGKPEETATTDGGTAPVATTPVNRVLYNGDLYETRLYITPDQEEGVAFDGNAFHVYLQTPQADPSALVTQWLRDKASETLTAKTQELAAKIGVEYNNIVFKDQRTLWASCSGKKNINYSYRIIKMPPVVQDYLVIHELCHLVHMNHGPEYWQLVGQFSPDYKNHRRWLNDHKDAVFEDVKLTTPQDQTQVIATSAPIQNTTTNAE